MWKLTRGMRLMSEEEWRGIGIAQSPGWQHYEIFHKEPHILLFRRPLSPVHQPPVQRDPIEQVKQSFVWTAQGIAAIQHIPSEARKKMGNPQVDALVTEETK